MRASATHDHGKSNEITWDLGERGGGRKERRSRDVDWMEEAGHWQKRNSLSRGNDMIRLPSASIALAAEYEMDGMWSKLMWRGRLGHLCYTVTLVEMGEFDHLDRCDIYEVKWGELGV